MPTLLSNMTCSHRYSLLAVLLHQCFLSGSIATEENLFIREPPTPADEAPLEDSIAASQDEFLHPFITGEVVNFTISSDPDLSDLLPRKVVKSKNGRRTRRTYRLRHEGATYIALHFASMNLEDGCRLVVRDRPGTERYVLKGQDKMGMPQFWAQLILGDIAILSLICNRNTGIGEFYIDQYAAGFESLSPDASSGTRNLRGINDLPPWEQERQLTVCSANDKRNSQCYEDSHPTEYKKSRAVGKVVIQGVGVCTGWLIGSKNVFVTNSHCISTNEAAINADYIFNLEVQDGGGDCTRQRGNEGVQSGVPDFYTAEMMLSQSSRHDYVLILLSGNPAGKYGFLETESRETDVGEEVYIPQHPRGFDKEIALHDSQYGADQRCRTLQSVVACYSFRNPSYLDVRYTCDTEGGSSGSPVISAETNKVIALHHCGEVSTCSGNEGVPMTYLHNAFLPVVSGDSLLPAAPTNVCQDDQYEVILQLQTDFFGYETTWELRDSNDALVVEGGKDLYLHSDDLYEFKYCLPKEEHTLTIEDSYQDGMCCQHSNGGYTVTIDGEQVATGGDFEASVTINFGSVTATDSPTSGPTSMPTLGPTSKPTSEPTGNPTSDPTPTPTSEPTSNPTSGPTSDPTSGPTLKPTLTPTSGPTSSPTSAPSTRRPTFVFFTPSSRVGFDGPRVSLGEPVIVDGPEYKAPSA